MSRYDNYSVVTDLALGYLVSITSNECSKQHAQVPREVNVEAIHYGQVVAEKLERDDDKQANKRKPS